MWAYISQFGAEHLYGVISIDQTPKMINDESWPYGMTGLARETRPAFFDAPLPKANKKSLNMFLIGLLLQGKKYLNFDHKGQNRSCWIMRTPIGAKRSGKQICRSSSSQVRKAPSGRRNTRR